MLRATGGVPSDVWWEALRDRGFDESAPEAYGILTRLFAPMVMFDPADPAVLYPQNGRSTLYASDPPPDSLEEALEGPIP